VGHAVHNLRSGNVSRTGWQVEQALNAMNQTPSRMELGLGLQGFARSQVQAIHEHIGLLNRNWRATWVPARADEADAVLVNAAAPSDRPFHSTAPHATLDWHPDADRPHPGTVTSGVCAGESLLGTLLAFEQQLSPVGTRYALATNIHSRFVDEPGVNNGLWHVTTLNASLVAVVDFLGQNTAVSPRATAVDFGQAIWSRRPPSALAPSNFIPTSLDGLMWEFARRSSENLLPEPYWNQRIQLRHMPSLGSLRFTADELQLLDALQAESATVEQLAAACQRTPHGVARTLAGLYFAGAIKPVAPASPMRRFLAQWLGSDPRPDGSSRPPKGNTLPPAFRG
jgi:hypothetical protein